MPPCAAGYARSLRCHLDSTADGFLRFGRGRSSLSALQVAARASDFPGRERDYSMILAALAAATLVVSVATGPTTEPSALPPMSVQQKSAAMQPLLRSATECIARTVSTDPRFGRSDANFGDLIVASMPHCTAQVRAMIEAYDRYFGDGEGEAFFMGPYLDVLPTAVSKWVRDAVK
jgi:hypothetical protein